MLNMVHVFLNNYTDLNKLNRFKVDILLEFDLPLINSKKIAKKIVDNSKA